MDDIDKLLTARRPFLTDGGFETWLFFQQGFEAPEFAAIVLLDDPSAQAAMRRYFEGFLKMAETSRTGFVLDTNSWRGGPHWATALGRSEADMLRLNAAAVAFAKAIRDDWKARVSPIVLNGVVGPAGDAYAPGKVPSAAEAYDLHRPQIEVLASQGVDMISAITMSNVNEAIGITKAASALELPVVISFTVETDGRLPTGQSLGDAINMVDEASERAPAYYMVNCAHPDHFRDTLSARDRWVERIGGVRANASRLSHAELDAAETLDDGDPDEFGRLYAGLAGVLPNLRVIGGCCGTDHRHVGCASRHLHVPQAA